MKNSKKNVHQGCLVKLCDDDLRGLIKRIIVRGHVNFARSDNIRRFCAHQRSNQGIKCAQSRQAESNISAKVKLCHQKKINK